MSKLSGRLLALVALPLALAACPGPSATDGDAGGADASPLDAAADAPGATCADPDRDRDGADSVACGGLDCDDDDPQSAPGRVEFCDPDDRDEDCDPTTFGIRDLDLDGDPDDRCCNADGAGGQNCGTDCDDVSAGVSSTATEACNALDDDCDGSVDEMVAIALWPDADRDGYGDSSPAAVSVPGCPGRVGFSDIQGDCDETAPSRHVGASEVCNGIDDDCDMLVDDIVDGSVFCRSGETGACTGEPTCGGLSGTHTCAADCLSWDACVTDEVCNGCDDDDDGLSDDGFMCVLDVLSSCTTSCGTTGSAPCGAGCLPGTCRATEICNFCDDDATDGIAAEVTLATASDAARILEPGGTTSLPITVRYAGVASPSADGAPAPAPSGSVDYFVELLDGAVIDQVGAYWVDLSRYQGWGPTTIHVELDVRMVDGFFPMGGWSVVVGTGGTGDLGTSREAGVPLTRAGAQFTWLWGWVDTSNGFPSDADRMLYGILPPAGDRWRGQRFTQAGRGIFGANFDGETSWVRQEMTIVYQPENPYTSPIEEVATITFADGRSHVYRPDGDGNTVDPQSDVPVGSRLSIGITAGSYGYTFSPGGPPVTVGARVEARLRLRTFIMPPATLPPQPDQPHSTIARAGICPGAF